MPIWADWSERAPWWLIRAEWRRREGKGTMRGVGWVGGGWVGGGRGGGREGENERKDIKGQLKQVGFGRALW